MSLALGVLASRSGSNFEAIGKAAASGELEAQVKVLVCNVAGAGALARAEALGIDAVVLPHKDFPSRAAFETRLCEILEEKGVEQIALAGFMRLLGPTLLSAYPHRIVNIHPALLPAFPGLHAARQALAADAKESGCTIHLVDAGCDTGPRLAQASVPVNAGDDEASLSARIQQEEHRLYPRVLNWIARGHLQGEGGTWGLEGIEIPDENIRIFDRAANRSTAP